MSVYLAQCWECRESVQPSECEWIWITAGGLTACRYVCPDCQTDWLEAVGGGAL